MNDTETQPVKGGGLPKSSHRFRKRVEAKQSLKRGNTLNIEKIKSYAEVGCTYEEIAALIGVTADWLQREAKKDGNLEEALIVGSNNMKESIRRAQVKLALTGHPGMLIWLGKQFLGQSDKQESKSETTVNVVLQEAMKQAREMTAEDLIEMKKIFERNSAPHLLKVDESSRLGSIPIAV